MVCGVLSGKYAPQMHEKLEKREARPQLMPTDAKHGHMRANCYVFLERERTLFTLFFARVLHLLAHRWQHILPLDL